MTHIIVSHSPGFEELALNEIQREHPDAAYIEQLSAGITLVDVPGSFTAFARPWLEHLPIYLHHIHPADIVTSDITTIADHTQPMVRPNLTLSVQARQAAIGEELPEHPAPHADKLAAQVEAVVNQRLSQRVSTYYPAQQILSVLDVDGTYYAGISLVDQNISSWPGGALRFRVEPISRAEFKLREALVTFGIILRRGDQAVDLGAAPGGWSRVLQEKGLDVVAVDQAEMHPDIRDDVTWRRMTAEDYLDRVEDPIGVLTCDMIMDAQDAAELMVAYAEHVTGIGIMTLKLRGHNRRRVMDHSFRILREAYHIVRIRQLYYNRSEITLYLRRV